MKSYSVLMKHLICVVIFLTTFAVMSTAQEAGVASPAGSSYIGSLGYISYTIGEPVVGVGQLNDQRSVIHGFEQPRSFKAFNDSYSNNELDFAGVVMENGNFLTWTLSQIVEGATYSLMHSDDGIDFTEVVEYGETGNLATDIHTYNFLHVDAPKGISYYYISKTLIDGMVEKSQVLTLFRETYSLTDHHEFSFYPNPVVDVLNLELVKGDLQNVNIHLLEVSSRLLESIDTDLTSGQVQLDLGKLRSGIYILTVFDLSGNLVGIERIRKAN